VGLPVRELADADVLAGEEDDGARAASDAVVVRGAPAAADALTSLIGALVVPASRLEHEPRRRRLGTGVGALDDPLGGGWPDASLSELAGRRSAGRTAVLHASLAAALAREQAVALVDAAGALDPRSAEDAGVTLPRLLWVRAPEGKVLQAAEELIAAGGFGLVAISKQPALAISGFARCFATAASSNSGAERKGRSS